MIPARGLVLVRPVETEEALGGGKILLPKATREAMAAYQLTIVAVGAGSICEKPRKCDRRHVEFTPLRKTPEYYHPVPELLTEGAWVIVRPRSLTDASHDTERLFFVRQEDVLGVFNER